MTITPKPTTTFLTGRVALVTGGARGLGLEISRQLASQGAMVLVTARDFAKSEEIAESFRNEGLKASALHLDVTSDASRQAAYTAIDHNFGKLDILINNAAVWLDSQNAATPADRPPSEASEGVVRGTFETNFFAPVFLTQVMLPLLRKSEAGRIVNMSSVRGSLTHLSNPDSLVYPIKALGYDASKAALNAFTILIAEELRNTSIKVNSVHPGWVRTQMGSENADLSLEEGARSAVHYATIGADGPTGGFFFLDDRVPW